jgi:hypothetical protein
MGTRLPLLVACIALPDDADALQLSDFREEWCGGKTWHESCYM